MIIETASLLASVWGMHHLLHRAILSGLRAPRTLHPCAPADPGVPRSAWRQVDIPGPRGRRLFGWMVVPPTGARQPAPAVLVMHGWGANAATMWPVVPPLHAAGFAVLLIDARCHGRSGDEAFTSMPRFAEDIAAGLGWLRVQPDIAADRLALIGHSVGAAASLLHASRHHDVRAVVSLSAFAHPQEVMRRFMADKRVPYPLLGWYVLRHVQRVIGASFDTIAPLSTLARVRCPVLLVHGRGDTTVPFSDAERLQAVSGQARLLAVDGDHDLRDTLALHAPVLVDFLRSACSASLADSPAGARDAAAARGRLQLSHAST
jgi:pimeloyl-ACP methyl ester carboxylesterase